MDSKTGMMSRARYAVRSMCTVLDLSVPDISWVTQWSKSVSENRQGIALVSHSFSKESFSDLFASPFSGLNTKYCNASGLGYEPSFPLYLCPLQNQSY